ncbi:hypothetical protein JCGZ_07071 [Jatropha curcas]|uniref:Uncharacterized protein n=1 Tax=Jatropha curcas TaxID=180498 RepID=A0A067KMI4_JATCU|nr:hypothetical protein JCGZ_07071 [Jatropha curcas]
MIAVNLQERSPQRKTSTKDRERENDSDRDREGTGIEIKLMIWKVKSGRGIAVKRVEVESGIITTGIKVEKEIELGGDG